MRIGMIGAGNMGAALGKIWAKAGHDVIFSYSRDENKLRQLAASAGETAQVGTPQEAVAHSAVSFTKTSANAASFSRFGCSGFTKKCHDRKISADRKFKPHSAAEPPADESRAIGKTALKRTRKGFPGLSPVWRT